MCVVWGGGGPSGVCGTDCMGRHHTHTHTHTHIHTHTCAYLKHSPTKGYFFMSLFVTAFHPERSPCLSTTAQKNIQSKCVRWFIMNKHFLLNFPSKPNVLTRIPRKYSVCGVWHNRITLSATHNKTIQRTPSQTWRNHTCTLTTCTMTRTPPRPEACSMQYDHKRCT